MYLTETKRGLVINRVSLVGILCYVFGNPILCYKIFKVILYILHNNVWNALQVATKRKTKNTSANFKYDTISSKKMQIKCALQWSQFEHICSLLYDVAILLFFLLITIIFCNSVRCLITTLDNYYWLSFLVFFC